MPPSDKYAAKYDLGAKIMSAVACLVIFAGALAAHNILVGSLAMFIMFWVYAYSPRGYRIADGAIAVRRWIGDVRIPLSIIRESRRATKEDFRRGIRLWGSGGLFGYYGIFQTARLGRCTWYLTNRKDAVVLSAGSKTILLSPDNPDVFLQAIATREN